MLKLRKVMKRTKEAGECPLTICVDKSIYSREVLLKTAYCFTDKVYLHLAQNDAEWIVSWTPKENCDVSANEFENELISQQLRIHLLEKTSDIRKLVLARAFASTIIDDQQDPIDEADYREDVADDSNSDILKGWFEKNDRI